MPFTCVWGGFSFFVVYGAQIARHHFNLVQSLFGLPFLLGCCALLWLSAMSLFGRIVLTRRRDQVIRLQGERTLSFGSTLSAERRYFRLTVLREALNATVRSSTSVISPGHFH